MKKIVVYIYLLILLTYAHGQGNISLSGKVYGRENQTLPGATIVLFPSNAHAVTDSNGNFTIHNLLQGEYFIEISFIGYKTFRDTIIINKDSSYNAYLTIKNLSLQEVQIIDNYAENRQKEESLSIEIVNADYVKQNLGASLMNSLERLPGVSSIDIGSGQAKPVIRGLSFNRVVLVENGIRHEAQQWGADHGLEIDQYAVDYVEVIKGPASLMYGSDAIAGVIDIKSKFIPESNTYGAHIDLSAKSNNDFLGSSVSVFGRKKSVFAIARISIIDYADYRVPADSVDIYSYKAALYKNSIRNTAGNELNYHFTAGIIKNNYQSKLFISSVNAKNGFFANAYGLEPRNVDTTLHDKSNRDIHYPFQEASHFKVVHSVIYSKNTLTFQSHIGFQKNKRNEWSEYVSHGYMPAVFPDSLTFPADLERSFNKNVLTGNIKLIHQIKERTFIYYGISSEYQRNEIDGRGFIIPKFTQFNGGGYSFIKHSISKKSLISLGIRYDYGTINISEYFDWFASPVVDNNDTTMQYLQRAIPLERHFHSVSYGLGYSYNGERWSIKTNFGKSFRMPIAKELAANGVNYHRFSFEIGNTSLSPEVSYQLDASAEMTTKTFVIGISPFVNYFPNYIYLNPSYEHDRLYGNGNQIYYYTQSSVFRFGAELHSHLVLTKSIQMGIIGEYVYSEQISGEKKGFTLPFSPPFSAIINLKFQREKWLSIYDAYFSTDYRISAAQNRIVPPETQTKGYQTINIRLGGDLYYAKQKISLSLQVQNLLNTKYFNHTNYYRLINVPETGRNFIINVSIPVSGSFSNKTKINN